MKISLDKLYANGNLDTYEYFHFLVETVIHNKRMAHAYPCRFHSMRRG